METFNANAWEAFCQRHLPAVYAFLGEWTPWVLKGAIFLIIGLLVWGLYAIMKAEHLSIIRFYRHVAKRIMHGQDALWVGEQKTPLDLVACVSKKSIDGLSLIVTITATMGERNFTFVLTQSLKDKQTYTARVSEVVAGDCSNGTRELDTASLLKTSVLPVQFDLKNNPTTYVQF